MLGYATLAGKRAVAALGHSSFNNSGTYTAGLDMPELPFAFAFEDDITTLQRAIVTAADTVYPETVDNRAKNLAFTLGIRATVGYLSYAASHLEDDQLTLAPSVL